MSIKTDLQFFYDHEAKKYAETRQKFRHEGERILQQIEKLQEQKKAQREDETLHILELGAGSGRFATFLNQQFDGKYTYIGCDLSSELLKYAKKDNPKMHFETADMLTFLAAQPQESCDIIIATASFQHLPTRNERYLLIKYAYRTLKYNGIMLMTNRAFSTRFLRKHPKIFLKSLTQTVLSLWKKSRRDVFIPRKNRGKTYQRFYHLFSLKELKKLTLSGSLVLQECGYIDKNGQLTQEWRNARNSRFVGRKSEMATPNK